MYFFSEEERKYLLKKLIPKAREKGIAEDLRGWNWHSTELSPPHDIFLPVWEVSDRYCETGRDCYLRHVQKVSVPASEEMVTGRIYHQVMAELYPTAKRLIYSEGIGICTNLPQILMQRLPEAVIEAEEQLSKVKCMSEASRDVSGNCLLYTSDAADDLLWVDLGGRRIIKKNITDRAKSSSDTYIPNSHIYIFLTD